MVGPSNDPGAYWTAVGVAALLCTTACVAARHRPGRWMAWVRYALALVLALVAVLFVVEPIADGTWTARASLPVSLCDAAVLLAMLACVRPALRLAVELTWFWGMAGTLQAVSTPDLNVAFPHLGFWEFVVGHLAIVCTALFLVVGLRIYPRAGAVSRVFALTVGYAGFVAVVDVFTGGNYMYLRAVPSHVSLLSVLGPWPWYLLNAAAVAVVLLIVLDLPFRHTRRAGRSPLNRSSARI